MTITFPTKPASRAIDSARTAILVVDMQNAFVSQVIRGAQKVVQVIQEVLDAVAPAFCWFICKWAMTQN
jgi:nicotinamidase-related amidase